MVKMLEVVRKKSKDKIVFFITLLNNTYQNGKKKKEYKEAKVTVFLLSKHRIGFFYLGDFFIRIQIPDILFYPNQDL